MLTRLKSLGIAISNQHGKTRRDALMLIILLVTVLRDRAGSAPTLWTTSPAAVLAVTDVTGINL